MSFTSTPFYMTSVADPIHGIIQFDRHDSDQRLLLEVMSTHAFQRLRRVRQMGLAEYAFPGATHSRFSHSVGATHLLLEALKLLKPSQALLDEDYDNSGIRVRTLLLLSILLHDIGHGPLSHTLEDLLQLKAKGCSHDDYWSHRILAEDAELCALWAKHFPEIPAETIPRLLNQFMGHDATHAEKHPLAWLVSSQLDMDRLDYLLRDSHFLGVKYGQIEARRILHSLEVVSTPSGGRVLAVREEGLPAVEHFLFGRHQAYKMANHPLDKSAETVLQKTLQRFAYLRKEQPEVQTGHSADKLHLLMNDPKALSVEQYLRMDDCYLWEVIHHWGRHSEDTLLKTLAMRLLRHDLFRFVDLAPYGLHQQPEKLAQLKSALATHYAKRGLDMAFCFGEVTILPKSLYRGSFSRQKIAPQTTREPIWIKTAQKTVVDLAEVSTLVDSSSQVAGTDSHSGYRHYWFVWDLPAKQFLDHQLEQLKNS